MSYSAGVWGELRAGWFLRKRRGMKLLEWRFRACGGEIDWVAREREVLVFVEVKSRPDASPGEGARAVTGDKCRRVRAAASAYIARHPAGEVRFDVVEISRSGVRHIPNAF